MTNKKKDPRMRIELSKNNWANELCCNVTLSYVTATKTLLYSEQ